MKAFFTTLFLLAVSATLLFPVGAEAQYRADLPSNLEWTGPVTKPHQNATASFLGIHDFRMNHAYEMSVGSFAGNMYNQNFYTNTMHFLFNENLYGRVDLSMAHSPFGNSMMPGNDQVQFFVRNAELNYRFRENTQIRLSFSQMPGGYGYYNPYTNDFHAPHQPFGLRGHSPFYGW